MVRDNSCVHLPYSYEATPLSHAAASRDWAFVEWLLEKGADPAADRRKINQDTLVYGINEVVYGTAKGGLRALVQKFESKRGIPSIAKGD